jgi:CHAD domain-containing protein
MQRREIADIINQRFDNINKFTRKIRERFNKKLVHELRLEIKELRAFLNLLRVEKSKKELRIRGRLKAFNGYIGIIRNLQLQERLVQELIPSNIIAVEPYLQQLHIEAQAWEKEVMQLTDEHRDFDEERDTILDALPDKLAKTPVRKFLKHKAEEIDALLMIQPVEEDNLHNLRKTLKDLLYTWPYVKHEADTLLPPEMNTRENLEKLTELLGNYGDQCTGLDLLQPAYIDKVQDPTGQELLQSVCTQLERNKEQFMRDFFAKLLALKQETPAGGC